MGLQWAVAGAFCSCLRRERKRGGVTGDKWMSAVAVVVVYDVSILNGMHILHSHILICVYICMLRKKANEKVIQNGGREGKCSTEWKKGRKKVNNGGKEGK